MATGIVYLLILVLGMVTLVSVVMWFERQYPSFGATEPDGDDTDSQSDAELDTPENRASGTGSGISTPGRGRKAGSGITTPEHDARKLKKGRLGNRMSFYGRTSKAVAAPEPKPSRLRRMSTGLAQMLGMSRTDLTESAETTQAFTKEALVPTIASQYSETVPESRANSSSGKSVPIGAVEAQLEGAVGGDDVHVQLPASAQVFLGKEDSDASAAKAAAFLGGKLIVMPADMTAQSWVDFRVKAANAVSLPGYGSREAEHKRNFEIRNAADGEVVYGLSQLEGKSADTLRLVVCPTATNAAIIVQKSGTTPAGTEPGPQLVAVMTVVYPTVLGLFETMVQVCMKAGTSMAYLALDPPKPGNSTAVNATLANTSSTGLIGPTNSSNLSFQPLENQAESPVLYIVILLLLFGTVMVIRWLRKVYSKFETSDCLPVEYGVVTSLSVCSGLVFFREFQCIATLNIVVMGCCMVGVIVGISILSAGKGKDGSDMLVETGPRKADMELESGTGTSGPPRRSFAKTTSGRLAGI